VYPRSRKNSHRAKVPLQVTVPRSLAYDYRKPELTGKQRSIQLTVQEGEN
jgi:hypothetical protein